MALANVDDEEVGTEMSPVMSWLLGAVPTAILIVVVLAWRDRSQRRQMEQLLKRFETGSGEEWGLEHPRYDGMGQ